jgi:hypothetical protein
MLKTWSYVKLPLGFKWLIKDTDDFAFTVYNSISFYLSGKAIPTQAWTGL